MKTIDTNFLFPKLSIFIQTILALPHSPANVERILSQIIVFIVTIMLYTTTTTASLNGHIIKRSYSDQSVHGYMTERTCWWNEVCKEEFQNQFRCRCPQFSYCRSPGRYYNAYCSMTDTGYIWTQPTWDWVPQSFPNV